MHTGPPCDLTGHWLWDESSTLDIEIKMTGALTFNVTLYPLGVDWKTAVGENDQYDCVCFKVLSLNFILLSYCICVCVCVCGLSHWVHAAIVEVVPDLPSLKCSSH
jgi:hypothetical protein